MIWTVGKDLCASYKLQTLENTSFMPPPLFNVALSCKNLDRSSANISAICFALGDAYATLYSSDICINKKANVYY